MQTGGKMKKLNSVLLTVMMLGMVLGMSGVMAADADTPYTVSMNFIVGDDTSFSVVLAGAETTVDFNPTTKDDKEVEPDSQDAGGSTPILVITNDGNTNLDFAHLLNTTAPEGTNISYATTNAVDWSQELLTAATTIDTGVAAAGTVDVYLWANFTDAASGTTEVLYQINSTAS